MPRKKITAHIPKKTANDAPRNAQGTLEERSTFSEIETPILCHDRLKLGMCENWVRHLKRGLIGH
jgi:hypothetical protein